MRPRRRCGVADQKLSIIGTGDYKFVYDFPTQKGNAAFDECLADVTLWRLRMRMLFQLSVNINRGDAGPSRNSPRSRLNRKRTW